MASLYPLRFEPIFQYRMWGGRRLEGVLDMALPGEGPIGEAWVLSDRDDFPSRVLNGALAGKSISELAAEFPTGMLGGTTKRYPLLLKFLDAQETLSVQVHPSDAHKELLPPGERGKTEAWVVLEAEPGSLVYAGLNPGTTPEVFRQALEQGTVAEDLASFEASVGETVFLEAGTVHALGAGLVVFEVQQNSDVTFRIFDWNRVEPATGKPRELHIEQALACTDFGRGPVGPSLPVLEEDGAVRRERLVDCEFFTLRRIVSGVAFTVGSDGEIRTIICLEGAGVLEFGRETFEVGKGQVWVLPAEVGACEFTPSRNATLFEVALAGSAVKS